MRAALAIAFLVGVLVLAPAAMAQANDSAPAQSYEDLERVIRDEAEQTRRLLPGYWLHLLWLEIRPTGPEGAVLLVVSSTLLVGSAVRRGPRNALPRRLRGIFALVGIILLITHLWLVGLFT